MKTSGNCRWARLTAMLLMAGACLSATTLILSPSSGNLTGAPGQIVGWDWSIDNDTSNYMEISNSQFCLDPVALPFCTAPDEGTYNDIIGGNGPVIAPGVTTTVEDFDPVGFTTGLGWFQIDPSALGGASDTGQIVLTYDTYSVDPNDPNACLNPDGCQNGFSLQIETPASVTVTATLAIPEPSPGWLALGGLLAVAGAWRRGRARSTTR